MNVFLQVVGYCVAIHSQPFRVLMAASKSNITLRKPGKSAGKQAANLTREQIADYLAAFRKSGGNIERLGNTNTFKKIG
jgi:hypothetical protein